MSIEAMAIALHHSRAKGATKLVLVGIANHDGDGGAWPSVKTLAKYAGCTPQYVQRAVKELESLGEVRREVMGGGDRNTADHMRPNLYHFLLRCPPRCDGSKNHKMPNETLPLQLIPELSTPPNHGLPPKPELAPGANHGLPEPSFNQSPPVKEESSSSNRANSADLYERAIVAKCPRSRRGHDFASSGYCNNCGHRLDERVLVDLSTGEIK